MTPEISGATRCLPLIGHPVVQVKSPERINRHFAENGIDAVMFPVDLAPDRVSDFFAAVRGWQNCLGISVTYPHKQAACAQMDTVTERAARVGAVNTIRRDGDGQLHGDMTDGVAFVAALRETGAVIEGSHVLLVGAGGAGAAIGHAIAEAGAAGIVVTDLDPARQRTLVDALRAHYPDVGVGDEGDASRPYDIAVNGSTAGMREDDPLPFDVERLPASAIVADVVTLPEITPWLARARDRGHRIQTGIQMVDAQLAVQLRFLGYPVGDGTAADASTLVTAKG